MPRVKLVREHECHRNLLRRCDDPYDSNYHKYGAKGTTYDPSWVRFENFYADMGPMPVGKSLERLDRTKPYSKDNCVWANYTVQNRNRGCNKMTLEKAEELRSRHGAGASQRSLAKYYGLSTGTVCEIVHHKLWIKGAELS